MSQKQMQSRNAKEQAHMNEIIFELDDFTEKNELETSRQVSPSRHQDILDKKAYTSREERDWYKNNGGSSNRRTNRLDQMLQSDKKDNSK